MSKHSKALRDVIGMISSPVLRGRMYEAADHMEKLERERRIARKALTEFKNGKWSCGLTASHEAADVLAAMRQARRKP